jgi:hypothetical protein
MYYHHKADPQAKFTEAQDVALLYNTCIYGGSHCAIVMLDGERDAETGFANLDYKRLSSIVRDIPSQKKLHVYTNFLIANATCHHELATSFRVSLDRLPQVVVYDSKLQMYTKLKAKELTEENVYTFLVDAVESRVMYTKLNREKVIFKEKDCRAITKKTRIEGHKDNNNQGYDDEDDDDFEELNLPEDTKDEF